jgi:acylphosphatase
MSQGGEPMHSVRVRIEGHVQGVGYRYWVERTAGRLALSGWVRNRRDGSVEAVFSGAADKVADMIERCRQGPPAASVTSVSVTEEEAVAGVPAGFDVLPTA